MTRFAEDSHPDRRAGFQLGFTPEQMVWDGDKIYLAWRRQAGRKALLNANQTYESLISVISYTNGSTIAQLPLPGVDKPMLSVFSDKMLTVF